MATVGTRAARRRSLRTWAPALPVLAGLLVLLAPERVGLALGGLLGIGFVLVVSRSPVPALLAFPAVLPFQLLLLALLLRLGVPAGAVRALGFWKEAVAGGLVVAAISRARATGARIDAIDVVAALFVLNGLVYRIAPGVLTPGVAVPDANTLNLALRGNVLLVVLFAAARHLDVGDEVRARFVRVVVATGAAVAAIGVLETLLSSAWNRFAVQTVGVPAYKAEILNAINFNPNDIRVYTRIGGRVVVRIGSVFFSQISLGLFLVIVLAVALELLARQRGPRWVAIATPAIGAALLLTQTRAAILAAGLCVVLALRPAPGRETAARERVGIALAGVFALLIPLAVSAGLGSRALDSLTERDQSTIEHENRTSEAFDRLVHRPLGSGLGTTSEVARRQGSTISGAGEDYYLDLGNETGVQSALLFIALTVLCLAVLQRRTHAPDGQPIEAAWRGALAALALAALVHPVWFDQILAWPFWIGVGLAVGPPRGPLSTSLARYPDPPAT
jgi:hypothetical protein